jgi:hypothetical protein
MALCREANQRKGQAHMRHSQADQLVSMLNSMQIRNRKYILTTVSIKIGLKRRGVAFVV